MQICYLYQKVFQSLKSLAWCIEFLWGSILLIVELSWLNIYLLILLQMFWERPLLSHHESILPFMSGIQSCPDWAESPILQSQRATVLLWVYATWNTKGLSNWQCGKLHNLINHPGFSTENNSSLSCNSIEPANNAQLCQPFMNFLVNVMSFLRNKISHRHSGRGILDQL